MQVCAITTDNASNNVTMIDEPVKTMCEINPLFDRKHHMSCLGHILNLAVQDYLKELKTTIEEDTSTLGISSSKLWRCCHLCEEDRQVMKHFCASLKHRNVGQTKFITLNSQR